MIVSKNSIMFVSAGLIILFVCCFPITFTRNIDVGASYPFVSLEHVNINTGGVWNSSFDKFYFRALGFVEDPRAAEVLRRQRAAGGTTTGLVWANIGLQQIHFPSDTAQRVRGSIGLEYDNLTAVVERLQSAQVAYSLRLQPNGFLDHIVTMCPVGNEFHIHQQQHHHHHHHQQQQQFQHAIAAWQDQGQNENADGSRTTTGAGDESSKICVEGGNDLIVTDKDNANANSSWLGPAPHIAPHPRRALPGGMAAGLGMSYLQFDCPRNTARKICRFYNHFFQSAAQVEEVAVAVAVDDGADACVGGATYNNCSSGSSASCSSNISTTRSALSCVVRIGYRQHIRYTEIPAASTANTNVNNTNHLSSNLLRAYDGHHIAVYVSNFTDIYNRVAAYNLHWDNPRFPQFSYRTLQQALHHNEFRVKDIIDLDSEDNEVVYEMEHEIRYMWMSE